MANYPKIIPVTPSYLELCGKYTGLPPRIFLTDVSLLQFVLKSSHIVKFHYANAHAHIKIISICQFQHTQVCIFTCMLLCQYRSYKTVIRRKSGWRTCDFASFSRVFHSYQDDGG